MADLPVNAGVLPTVADQSEDCPAEPVRGPTPADLTPGGSAYRQFWRRFRRRRLAVASLVVLVLYAAAALGVWGYEYWCRVQDRPSVADCRDLEQRDVPPSRAHLLGTDYLGRDVCLRTVFATRTAFEVGLLAGVISLLVGVSLGAVAGYFGGWLDVAVVWVYSTFAAMPTLLFILSFALLLGRGTAAVYIGIGLTSWVGLCRVIRAEFIRLRDLPYVEAARVQGIGAWRIVLRHVLPNTAHLIIVFFTLRFGAAIMTEVIVSFLGVGVQMEPSWGTMIAEAKDRLWQGMWWELAAATGAMFFLVLAINLVGDTLRDLLDPRLRGV